MGEHSRVLCIARLRTGAGSRSTEVPASQQRGTAGDQPEIRRMKMAIAAAEPVQIEHAVTADDDHGPYPPPGEEGWHAVRSADGRTLWRKITLGKLTPFGRTSPRPYGTHLKAASPCNRTRS
jgi:hypothetical protein